MSDPKRAHLITVAAPKSAKNKVIKTVRLTINLVESNESKYPELNYKELVIAEERKKKVPNGKTTGLDPFSDNDDDVERVARKFEQKYGGKSTYGRKGRSKHDDFADIGAGYDENDSFIDNTDGYDEMIPPAYDTYHGGFYINCGSLEFKNVENQSAMCDGDAVGNKRNKRRISSSSSEEETSESSSESESQDEKDTKAIANGDVDSHKTEHRKKKNKKIDKKKAKKIRRTDSSAATSGKQTSDDNNHGDGESADSRTSQSDSLTSKPAPSSENPITSDSSRDVDSKIEIKFPQAVTQALEEIEVAISKQLLDNPNTPAGEMENITEQHVVRLERALCTSNPDARVRRAVWTRAARALRVSRTKLQQRVKIIVDGENNSLPSTTPMIAQPTTNVTTNNNSKRKQTDDLDDFVVSQMSSEQKEIKIVDTLHKLKVLIEERKPAMIANYDAECKRVQEERKKIMIASAAEGAPHIEKRLPKRRFPWCGRSRALLARLTRLAESPAAAATLLAQRALPLFPNGFVRMPTLLRQADLSKEIKVADLKRQRSSPTRAPVVQPSTQFTEPILFPSSLTVTTSIKTMPEADKDKFKENLPMFPSILNSFTFSKDLVVENAQKKEPEKSKEELYVPPNNIGSITITPVPNNKPEKKIVNNIIDNKKEPLIRVKSPAALNDMVKKDKQKKEKTKEKSVASPLHIDTSYQTAKKDPSPKSSEMSQKQIDNMKIKENNIPRPALIPVNHSPTFAKPDKRPIEKKKKDVLIISDLDPLADVQSETVAIDDSSSDVEVIEDKSDKSADKNDKCAFKSDKSEPVPLKDKVTVRDVKMDAVKHSSKDNKDLRKEKLDEATKEDIDIVMRSLREMEHSQDTAKFTSSSYGGVITSAKHQSSKQALSRNSVFGQSRSDKDKLTNFFEQNGWM